MDGSRSERSKAVVLKTAGRSRGPELPAGGLGGSQRGQISIWQRRQAKAGQDAVDGDSGDSAGSRDLQTDRPATRSEVDQHTRSSLFGPSAFLISLPREVEIGRKRP